MDTATTDALDWSFDFLARTLAGLVASLGFERAVPEIMARSARLKAMREVRSLEALARRLMLVLSGTIEIEDRINAAPRWDAPMPERPRKHSVNAPALRQVETEPDPWALAGGPLSGKTGPSLNSHAAPGEAVFASGLAARLEALRKLVADPDCAARRLALWHRRGGPKGRSVFMSLIRYPGRGRAPNSGVPESALWHAHQMAVAELIRACPGSPRPSRQRAGSFFNTQDRLRSSGSPPWAVMLLVTVRSVANRAR